MSKMIALVHECAEAGRGIGWNTRDVRALSQEINELTPQTARKILSAPTSGESRTMQQVRQHVNEGVVLVSSRTHADPIDLPKVLAEYDEVRAARDASYKAYDVFTGAISGALEGAPADRYANQLPPEQYDLVERIALERVEQQGRTPTPPVRKLRPYKGVTYRDGAFRHDSELNGAINAVTACSFWIVQATDADHAALLALRDDPWEKVETLEEVVKRVADACDVGGGFVNYCTTQIRAWLATQEPTS
jgi:hypothetical protein